MDFFDTRFISITRFANDGPFGSRVRFKSETKLWTNDWHSFART